LGLGFGFGLELTSKIEVDYSIGKSSGNSVTELDFLLTGVVGCPLLI
jgi:hypothetical protein